MAEPGADPTHLRHALAVTAGSQVPPTAQDDQSAAIRLAGLIRDSGDPDETIAQIRTLVHQMEHGLSPMRPDPWRLLVETARRLICDAL